MTTRVKIAYYRCSSINIYFGRGISMLSYFRYKNRLTSGLPRAILSLSVFITFIFSTSVIASPVVASKITSNLQSAVNFNDAKALMRHIDRLWRSDSAHSTMSMSVQTRRYSRAMKMETWSKGKERSLIIIREPKKRQGYCDT